MPLTVGTDAYSTLAAVRAYWSARNNELWADVEDAVAEGLIRQATDYVDRNWDFIGDKANGAQRLKWPRKFAEVEGYLLDDTTIPWQVQEATAEAAELLRLGTFDLQGVVTDDNASIQLQKVDVITVQYDTTKRLQGADVPTHIHKLLRPLVRSTNGELRRT